MAVNQQVKKQITKKKKKINKNNDKKKNGCLGIYIYIGWNIIVP